MVTPDSQFEAPRDFDVTKSRDIEWAVWNRGERSHFVPPASTALRCCERCVFASGAHTCGVKND